MTAARLNDGKQKLRNAGRIEFATISIRMTGNRKLGRSRIKAFSRPARGESKGAVAGKGGIERERARENENEGVDGVKRVLSINQP